MDYIFSQKRDTSLGAAGLGVSPERQLPPRVPRPCIGRRQFRDSIDQSMCFGLVKGRDESYRS